MSKTILITGTSSRLGINLAVQAGHTVYATMRNRSKRSAPDTAATRACVDVKVLQLDVQDSVSIAARWTLRRGIHSAHSGRRARPRSDPMISTVRPND